MIIHEVDKPHRKVSTLYQLSSTGPGYSLQKSYISESSARRFEASRNRNGSQLQHLHNLRSIGSGKVSRTIPHNGGMFRDCCLTNRVQKRCSPCLRYNYRNGHKSFRAFSILVCLRASSALMANAYLHDSNIDRNP